MAHREATDTGNGVDGGTDRQTDAGGQSASLPLPVRTICALFRPVALHSAEEIKVDIHNAAAAVMGDGTDDSGTGRK